MDDGILLFHGSKEEVICPEIRITRYTKDFSWGLLHQELSAGVPLGRSALCRRHCEYLPPIR